MNEATNTPARPGRAAWMANWVGYYADGSRLLERSAAPLIDLLIRLWLAQIFFVSGVLKVANWDNALYLAANEYPVSWMAPVTAAYLGAAIELGASLLLALGLATRFAALAMLVLTLVIQFNYSALDTHLFWAALFGWFVVCGAGRISLDHAVYRGLADSALPFASAGVKTLAWVSGVMGPVYQLLLRGWIAAAMVAATTSAATAWPGAELLPVQSATGFAAPLELVCAALLIAGLGTRLTALGLIGYGLGLQMTAAASANYSYWLMLLALLVLHGAGKLSLDASIERIARRHFPRLAGKLAFSLDGLPRVVIIGAGFGGLTCAAALTRARVSVTLIDRHNYHLFQPLLYQVATAALSPGDIATPVRGLFREYFNVRVLLGEVTSVDKAAQEVLLGTSRVAYDYLVLATGAAHSYFGRDEWEPYAPGLKRVEDATEVRRRVLSAFEQAEATSDSTERQGLLTFLIVGGGPTGVELAGAIAELAKFGMEKEFRQFDPATARVLLVQAGPRILPTFPEDLSETTAKALEKLGVEVLVNSKVEQIDATGVLVNGQHIPARTVLLAAGVVASPAAKWLGVEADNAGRIKVEPDLSVPGLPKVFAIGDTALTNAWNGRPVPGLAPAAKQGGAYVAKVIRARVAGRSPPRPFSYQHLGSLATIGRKAAVADFGRVKLSGGLAWWLWGLVHVAFLVGLRNRMSVMFDWFWAYLTYRSGTRLITGTGAAAPQAALQELSPPRRATG